MTEDNPPPGATRRQFLTTSAAGLAAALAATQAAAQIGVAPAVVTNSKTGGGPLIVGEGAHAYEVKHDWLQLPAKYTWQTTHNVAVDTAGNVYVIHEGVATKKDHPAIFVFDADGEFIRAFGAQFQGGGHGIDTRVEGGEEFLYVAAYQQVKAIAKLTLTGETVWHHRAPMESGRYAAGENRLTVKAWGRKHFLPTNFAFLNESEGGGFILADGYGAFCMHLYDKEGVWQSAFGKGGTGDGEFDTPHGLWIDRRGGGDPKLAVADRANGRLQWFTLDGKHLQTMDGFLLPANIDTRGEMMLVPDLQARVTLLDGENNVVAQLGEDPAWRKQVLADGFKLRREPNKWRPDRFLHPHDACFDAEGNILVAEWVSTGRVSKLTPVSV
ncbi:MAG: hypothetical protein AAF589_07250 [Planctomycetota bacterium]